MSSSSESLTQHDGYYDTVSREEPNIFLLDAQTCTRLTMTVQTLKYTFGVTLKYLHTISRVRVPLAHTNAVHGRSRNGKLYV